jgi:gluconolactonase
MTACNNVKQSSSKTIGSIERMDASMDAIMSSDASIEIIAEGHEWTEGPLWVESEKMLLYSDIPPNKIFKWTEAKGKELYLSPSGYTGSIPRKGEPGSNGLILNKEGKLVLCQHGDRRMALMDADLKTPAPNFITLADNYQGKKLNSPNDAVFRSNGDLFFTDPPYGLIDSSYQEIQFQGVYKVSNGQVTLLTDSITRPNGIAFTNNEKTLIVANSDPEKVYWYLFDITANDSLVNGRLLHDATPLSKTGVNGLPDGLKVDKQGNIFATGPGGVFIFNAAGKQIGKLNIPEACSNIALADDDKTLFITADMYVLRVKMRK